MAKFKLIQKEIEAITFDDLVEYGKNNGANIFNGMPWSFEYNGRPVTHENDKCYLIPTMEGGEHFRFTPEHVLITEPDGGMYPLKKDVFDKIYELSSNP